MEDFNIPGPERLALLEPLQEAIGGAPPHFWAACQICDLDALRRLVACGREYPSILRGYTQQSCTMAYYWGPCPPRINSQPSTPRRITPQLPTSSTISSSPFTPPHKRQKISEPSPVIRRNQQVRDLAKLRDGSRCALTGHGAVEVAHIYPYHSIKHDEADLFGPRHTFWDHLRNFWSKDKVAAWEIEVFPAGISEFGVDKVYNLITLSPNAHDMWARGAFALKPISESEDKMTLELQFFWQKKQENTQQTMSLLTKPSSTEGLNQNEGALEAPGWLYNNSESRRIRSGDIIKLETDDPDTKPLPSFQLLELQWFLQRVQGMAGAADIDWQLYSDSGSDCSDEEVPELVLGIC